ncbi:MAG: phenylalanine--tRNA ligase subunit beta [Lachnospiraceae bacterium]|jgi:phenylalanyl-tRNA synthetase beta chain|nr:phenylalanine--tRNA ligase subunit beta [Lachnospiraceae bacterium]
MKISLAWIKDFVEIPADLEITKLAFDLTMSTVEVEAVTQPAAGLSAVIVGEIKTILPHPNADKLKICCTDIGDGDIREIVCGGSNIYEGMKIAVAKPGAWVRWHGVGELVEIKAAKLRGVESYGMICAAAEIGLLDLFPGDDEAAVIDLSEFNVKTGEPLATALDLEDTILEIDNKSLTNRPDLWGHYGIAREISAIYDLPLIGFTEWVSPTETTLAIEITMPDLCRRYMGARIEGLLVKPSPFAIKSRLWRVGMKPINAIVDITNYVMLATGQPTHAFDADIASDQITIRMAKDGEKLLLLSEDELTLTAYDMVIANQKEAIALAGVMGGQKNSVHDTTKDVILEIANFAAASVRRSAARHEIRTESATRFEKAVDSERTEQALSLAMHLFREIYPQHQVVAFTDNYPAKLVAVKEPISVSTRWLIKRLGKEIPVSEIERILRRLGFTVEAESNTEKTNEDCQKDDIRPTKADEILKIAVPSWRATGDISIPEDIMEEVARLFGYENFAAADITTTFTAAINQPDYDKERAIKEYLAFRCGLREIFTYPWMNDEYISPFVPGINLFACMDERESRLSAKTLRLEAPPSPSESYLRSSLLPNICRAVSENLRYFSEFAIFEAARTFNGDEWEARYDEQEKLPLQRRFIAGAFVAPKDDFARLFDRVKGVLAALPRYTHIEGYTFARREEPSWVDPALWQNIIIGEQIIGNLGLLASRHALSCNIKNATVMLFELDIDALIPYASRTNRFSPLPEYPRIDYDLSVLTDTDLTWEQIEVAVREVMKKDSLIRNVAFMGEYQGEQIPVGKKSVTLRLTIGSSKKTLTAEETQVCITKVVKQLKRLFAAELRE